MEEITVSSCDFYIPAPRETMSVYPVQWESERKCYICGEDIEPGEFHWSFISDGGWGCGLHKKCLDRHAKLEIW